MNNKLVKQVVKTTGHYGIYESKSQKYNIVNLKTNALCPVLNFITVEDAEKYLTKNDF